MEHSKDMRKVSLSIIIVGLNVKEYLISCLKSVFNNSPPFELELIYVDNGSKDGTIKEIKKLKIKIIENKENLGFTQANNQGAREAKGEYLFFLNPDTEILGNTLEKMIDFMEKHSEVGVLGPKLYNSKKADLQITCTGRLDPITAIFAFSFLNNLFPNNYFSWKYFLKDWDRNSVKDVDVVSGAALMIRSDLFKKVGGFDERFFAYFEETDLCMRVKKMGQKILYYPEAEVIHYGGRVTNKIDKHQIRKIFFNSRFLFFRKNYGLIPAAMAEGTLRLFEGLARIA